MSRIKGVSHIRYNPCHEPENRPWDTPLCQKSCSNGYPIPYEVDKSFGKKPKYFYGSDESAIMKEILHNRPVAAGMDIYDDFQNYTGGIYARKST